MTEEFGGLDEILVIADSIGQRGGPVYLAGGRSFAPSVVPRERLLEAVGRQAIKDSVDLADPATNRGVAFGIILAQIFSEATWQDVIAAVRLFRE